MNDDRVKSLLMGDGAAFSRSKFSWKTWLAWLGWCDCDLERLHQWLTTSVSLQAEKVVEQTGCWPRLSKADVHHCTFTSLTVLSIMSVNKLLKNLHWVTSLFGVTFAETKDWDQNSVWDRRSAKSEVDFYSRRNSLLFRRLYMPWSDPSVRLSVCPSVLPSHSGVLSRRMKLRSCGFHRQVGHSS